jgi:hypothetical protein
MGYIRGLEMYSLFPLLSHQRTFMKTNVGGIDRIARIVIGLVLIGLAATGTVGVWGWLGVVPLATGAIGWCPPYAIFGWNTCSTRK